MIAVMPIGVNQNGAAFAVSLPSAYAGTASRTAARVRSRTDSAIFAIRFTCILPILCHLSMINIHLSSIIPHPFLLVKVFFAKLGKDLGGRGEDLGGRRDPLSEGVPSPSKPPSSSPNFPQEHPPLHCDNLFRFALAGALGGSFWFGREVENFCRVRLSRTVCEWKAEEPCRTNQ